MSVLLGLALFGPAALVVLARLAPTTTAARRWTSHASLVLAALWLVIRVVDADAMLGRFGAGVAVIAVGTWLLAASITWPVRRSTIALTAVAAATAVGGLALLAGGGDLSDAAGALGIAAAVALLAARTEEDGGLVPALAVALGVAAILGGIADDAPLLALVGGTAAVVGAGSRVRRAGVVLLPAIVTVTCFASLPSLDLHWWRVVAVALLATAVASRPAVSLALWALAAATLGVEPLLLGGAAVLAGVTLQPAVAFAALPGAAVVVARVDEIGSRWGVVLALLAAITVARLWRRPDDAIPGRPSFATLAALALGAWLLLAPETWLATDALESWGTGVAIVAVAGLVGAFVAASFTEAAVTVPDLEVADPAYAPRDPRWAWRAGVASLAILAISGGVLVASVIS